MQDVLEVFTDGGRVCVFVAGQRCDGVQRFLLIVEPAFESERGEVDLLFHRVVQLRSTQSPHTSKVQRANQDERHRYPGSEEQQFAANPQTQSPLIWCFESISANLRVSEPLNRRAKAQRESMLPNLSLRLREPIDGEARCSG